MKEKIEKETKRKMYITLGLILLFILFILFDEKRRKEKIESFTVSTIGLISKISKKESAHGYYNCRFYVNNKSFVSKVSYKSKKPILNRFYKVKYDKKNQITTIHF